MLRRQLTPAAACEFDEAPPARKRPPPRPCGAAPADDRFARGNDWVDDLLNI